MEVTGTTKDVPLLRLIESVSRAVDEMANRPFYHELATRYFDGRGKTQLWIDDLSTITTLKADADGDGVYELTLTESTDFWLYPDNSTPKMRIDINPQSAVLSRFPSGRRSVEIVSPDWGFSAETQLTGATVDDAPLAAGETTLNVVAGGGLLLDVGEVLILDSEQGEVTAIATDAITIVRGVNGTTDAAHVQTTPAYRRRFPRDIEEAVLMQTVRLIREQSAGHSGQVGAADVGGWTFQSLYPVIRDLIAPYTLPAVA